MTKRNKFNGRNLYIWSEALGITEDCIRHMSQTRKSQIVTRYS